MRLISQVEIHTVECKFTTRRDSFCALDKTKHCEYICKLKKKNPTYEFPFTTCINETCFIHVETAKRPTVNEYV